MHTNRPWANVVTLVVALDEADVDAVDVCEVEADVVADVGPRCDVVAVEDTEDVIDEVCVVTLQFMNVPSPKSVIMSFSMLAVVAQSPAATISAWAVHPRSLPILLRAPLYTLIA